MDDQMEPMEPMEEPRECGWEAPKGDFAEYVEATGRLVALWPTDEIDVEEGHALAEVSNRELFDAKRELSYEEADFTVSGGLLGFEPRPERVSELEATKARAAFIATGEERVGAVESEVEDVTLLLAEMIGGME